MAKYSYHRRKNWLRWLIIGLATLIFVIIVALGTTYYIYNQNLKPLSTDETSQLVVISSGSSADEIGKQLEDDGLIRAAWAFSLYTRLSGERSNLQAGTYALSPNMSIQDMVAIVTKGKVKTSLVTIVPGQRVIDQVRDSLINAGFDANAVQEAMNPTLYTDHPALSYKPAEASLEGYLYPESYQKTDSTTPEDIIRAALDEMNIRLSDEVKAGFAKQGLTPYQGLILASIVEKEVSNPSEKSQVAQVFLKRLAMDMALESDATAIYGAVLDGKKPSIFYESAYNTYKNKGLTPTPISVMSESSLMAVANPADTDWLFFVSGDDDVTYFSKTLSEHEALVRAHCKQKCSSAQ